MAEQRSHPYKKVKTHEESKAHLQTNLSFLDLLDIDNRTGPLLDSPLGNIKSNLPHTNTNMLFQLPTEIRNMIYEYAVGTPAKPLFLDKATTPALARTCRLLRKEALPVFFHINDFHVLAETPANSTDPTALAFKIGPETYTCLRDLGPNTPLFKSLHIHFNPATDIGLAIICDRTGVRLTHESTCQFCHAQPFVPVLPPSLYKDANPDVNMLQQLMALNRARMLQVRTQHAGCLAELKAMLIGMGAVSENAVALTLDDMKALEKGVSTGTATYALAMQGMNQSRLNQTPLFVELSGKRWSLCAD